MYKIYYLEAGRLVDFVNRFRENFNVFVPVKAGELRGKEIDYFYKKFKLGDAVIFNPYRAIEPLKTFFTPASESIAGYFTGDKAAVDLKKTIIFGVKNCDIAGHRIQDFVFLEGAGVNGECSRTIDSLYRLRRENTFFISGDCTDFKPVCHCLAWEIMPYCSGGFDLNLSPLNDGYLVEVGSKKGEELIHEGKEYFVPARDVQISSRSVKRENLLERLKRHLVPQDLVAKDTAQRLVKEGYSLDTWKQFMLTCVECAGCNFICDTCHCFLLSDKREGQQNKKIRAWDSCLYANYARVAGGANPLKTRAERLRNRFMKKFDFFMDNLGMPACCGCGRCIEVCPGKIDIRQVLKDLAGRLNVK